MQATFPGNTRTHIGDVMVMVKKTCEENGAELTLMEVAQGLLGSVPPEAVGTVSLETTAAMWIAVATGK
jgi:hypothetical protein